MHQVEAAPGQFERRQVGLQIEARHLSRQPVIAGMLQNFHREGRRPQVPIDDEHFLLCANAAHSTLNAAMLQHERERSQISQQSLHELMQLPPVKLLFNVMLAHINPYLIYAAASSRPRVKPRTIKRLIMLFRAASPSSEEGPTSRLKLCAIFRHQQNKLRDITLSLALGFGPTLARTGVFWQVSGMCVTARTALPRLC